MPVPSGFVNPADFPIVDPTTLPSGHAIVISDVFGTPANVLVDLDDIGGGGGGSGGSLAVTRDSAAFMTGVTTINTLGPQLYATGTSPTVNLGVSARFQPISAALTYWVAASGDDGNTGLSFGQAFLTLQRAIDAIAELDSQAATATIRVSGSVYVPFTTELKDSVASSNRIVRILGVSSGELYTDSSSFITSAMIKAVGSTRYFFQAIKFTHDQLSFNNEAITLWLSEGSKVKTALCDFSNLPTGGSSLYTSHVYAESTSSYYGIANTVSAGDANAKHVLADGSAYVELLGSYDLTSGPTLATFLKLDASSVARLSAGFTSTGAPATGCKQYEVDYNSVLKLNGATVPGDVTGTNSTGGQVG